jgi:DNA-binding MarR family transcriptional regulator
VKLTAEENAELDQAEAEREELLAARHARRAAEQPPAGDLFALLSDAELDTLAPPTWLVDGMVPTGGLVVAFGPSGCGKTFLALDWAYCIATGLPWYGRQTEPGYVVYIAAEGHSGLRPRRDAWKQARGATTVDRIRFLPQAVNLLDKSAQDRLRRTIASLPEAPKLIVVDTMARTMVGGDENTARDVGLFIDGLDKLRSEFGCTVMAVHHTGKDGADERGSSALRGAADTLLKLAPDGAALRLTCEKQKEAEPFDAWILHLEQVAESCVLRCGTVVGQLAPTELTILSESHQSFGTDWASATALKEASGVPKSSFYRSVRTLCDRGFLDESRDGRTVRYRLTNDGLAELVPSSPTRPNGTAEVSPTVPVLIGTVGLGTPRDHPNGLAGRTPDDLQSLVDAERGEAA